MITTNASEHYSTPHESASIIAIKDIEGIERNACRDGGWMTCAHAAHLTGDPSTIAAGSIPAIKCLLRKYPLMRSRLRIDGQRFALETFQYTDENAFYDRFFSMRDIERGGWQKIVAEQCNRSPYSDDDTIIYPLFYFIFLIEIQDTVSAGIRHSHLILFSDHTVSDGRTGYILINEFLQLIVSNNCDLSHHVNNELLPFISELIPRPYGFLYPILLFLATYFIKRQLKKLSQPRISVKSTPLINLQSTRFHQQRYENHFLFSSSSNRLYNNLRQQCKRYGMTLHGPLLGCLLMVLNRFFPRSDEIHFSPMSIGVPMDMRSRLPNSPLTAESIGMYVGFGQVEFNRTYPLRTTRFWQFAHDCMQKTHNQLASYAIPLRMHVLKDISNDARQFEEISRLLPEARNCEVSLSNLGRYPYPSHYNGDQLRLHGIHFVNNSSRYRASLVIFVSCVNDQQLDFSMAHEIDCEQKAKLLLDYYVQLLEACSDSESCTLDTSLEQLLRLLDWNDAKSNQ